MNIFTPNATKPKAKINLSSFFTHSLTNHSSSPPMDLTKNSPEEIESSSSTEQQQQQQSHALTLAPASISLSLSTLIPSHFIPPKQLSKQTTPNKLKIPSQIHTITLTSSLQTQPSKPQFKSTFSSNPLQTPSKLTPLRPTNPSSIAPFRRNVVVWFRNDLRIHDNESLSSANSSSTSILPIYIFDPRDYGKSNSGFDKTGPYRATFLLQSVANLRENLRGRGSDLVVRVGKPESVLLEVVRAVGADAVFYNREVSSEEVRSEERIEEVMKEEGVEVNGFWGSTLFHLEDLPFKLEEMPGSYGGFKEKVRGLDVRKCVEVDGDFKGLPKKGGVEAGEIPSLVDLGLNPAGQNGKAAANASLVGGETEAIQRLRNFVAECKAKPNNGHKNGGNVNIYGANFSCKISPWLAMGCLSPRSMFDELKKSVSSIISGASNQKNDGSGTSDPGMNWLMYELLWRDFFRFITRKYSCAKLKSYAPVTACTGVAA